MSWWATEGRDKLPSLDNLTIEIPKKGFETIDLSSAFAKAGGPPMDLANRLSPEFDLKDELLSGRVKVLTKPIVSRSAMTRRVNIRLVSISGSRNK